MDRVYVLVNPDNKRVKIGVTGNIEQRLSSLQQASGSEIYVYYITSLLHNAYTLEGLAHKHFANRRYLGEWFDIDPKDAENYIKSQVSFFEANSVGFDEEINPIVLNHKQQRLARIKREEYDENMRLCYKASKHQEIYDYEEHVLTEPLTMFKRIQSNVYYRKSTKEYFEIKYKNHQWIIKKIREY